MDKNNLDKKTLLFPGGFQFVRNYGGYDGPDSWLRENCLGTEAKADYFIGHSIGASSALSYFEGNPESKFILFNPLIKKRNILDLIFRWMRFLLEERIEWIRIVPVRNWISGFGKIWKLLKIDVLAEMEKIPKGNLIVLRGKNDRFFCDEESAKIIKRKNIRLIEVEAGHDWNKNVKEAADKLIFF
ncbi:MAG: hypothetical protein WC831_02930 [Parcubacteria group bacterium]